MYETKYLEIEGNFLELEGTAMANSLSPFLVKLFNGKQKRNVIFFNDIANVLGRLFCYIRDEKF